ncbi:hypothetical protein V6Z11_A01G232500 [Gossypium hirsutum]
MVTWHGISANLLHLPSTACPSHRCIYSPLPAPATGASAVHHLLQLLGITLKLKLGTEVALVGPSGGGKVTSSSISLLLFFHFSLLEDFNS